MTKTKNVIIATVITILALICAGCIKKQKIINPINAKIAAQANTDNVSLSMEIIYSFYWCDTIGSKSGQTKLNDINKTKSKNFYSQLFMILGKETTHIVLLNTTLPLIHQFLQWLLKIFRKIRKHWLFLIKKFLRRWLNKYKQ